MATPIQVIAERPWKEAACQERERLPHPRGDRAGSESKELLERPPVPMMSALPSSRVSWEPPMPSPDPTSTRAKEVFVSCHQPSLD